LGEKDEQDTQADQVRGLRTLSDLGAEDKEETVMPSIWIIEDLSNGTWRINQPYHLYKSEESAKKGLEKMGEWIRIPRRIMEYRAVEEK
jgi:hypothetical protein